MSRQNRSFQMLTALLGALMLCAIGSGCVQRRVIVRSNPPGAVVFVDNFEIGTTPCATDFIYYGTRDITLKKEGFETLTVKQPIPAPWYQYVPFDFVTENLIPGQIRDTRTFEYTLLPAVQVPPQDLVSRADNLRRGSHAGPVTPAMFAPAAVAPQFTQPVPTPLYPAQPAPALAPPGYLPAPGYLPPLGGAPPAEQIIAPPGQPLGR